VDYKGIDWTLNEGVLLVSICREGRRNAIDTATMNELTNVFTRADLDEEVRAVVVTGRGKYFCAGGDLGPGEATFDAVALGRATTHQDHVETGGPLAMSVFRSRKPIIAAINGPAVGIGITMTLPMDVRLATPGCKMAFPFVRRGIVPDACAAWFLPRIVGLSDALDWACSGRTFLAEEALEAGLIKRICPAETILADAMQMARDIVLNAAPVAVAITRQMFLRMAGAAHPLDAFKIESPAIFELWRSPDAREGVRAFLDKRPAHFELTVSKNMPAWVPWWSEEEGINRNVGGPATAFRSRPAGP
jgi:enoyl-CoA hydratase/carnithine racemase